MARKGVEDVCGVDTSGNLVVNCNGDNVKLIVKNDADATVFAVNPNSATATVAVTIAGIVKLSGTTASFTTVKGTTCTFTTVKGKNFTIATLAATSGTFSDTFVVQGTFTATTCVLTKVTVSGTTTLGTVTATTVSGIGIISGTTASFTTAKSTTVSATVVKTTIGTSYPVAHQFNQFLAKPAGLATSAVGAFATPQIVSQAKWLVATAASTCRATTQFSYMDFSYAASVQTRGIVVGYSSVGNGTIDCRYGIGWGASAASAVAMATSSSRIGVLATFTITSGTLYTTKVTWSVHTAATHLAVAALDTGTFTSGGISKIRWINNGALYEYKDQYGAQMYQGPVLTPPPSGSGDFMKVYCSGATVGWYYTTSASGWTFATSTIVH